MVVISDDLNHTKNSIFVFMRCIFQGLQAKFPGIETINVFSDGPTSQFKQRFPFSNLTTGSKTTTFPSDVIFLPLLMEKVS